MWNFGAKREMNDFGRGQGDRKPRISITHSLVLSVEVKNNQGFFCRFDN
jgi:hypothetical protein